MNISQYGITPQMIEDQIKDAVVQHAAALDRKPSEAHIYVFYWFDEKFRPRVRFVTFYPNQARNGILRTNPEKLSKLESLDSPIIGGIISKVFGQMLDLYFDKEIVAESKREFKKRVGDENISENPILKQEYESICSPEVQYVLFIEKDELKVLVTKKFNRRLVVDELSIKEILGDGSIPEGSIPEGSIPDELQMSNLAQEED